MTSPETPPPGTRCRGERRACSALATQIRQRRPLCEECSAARQRAKRGARARHRSSERASPTPSPGLTRREAAGLDLERVAAELRSLYDRCRADLSSDELLDLGYLAADVQDLAADLAPGTVRPEPRGRA